MDFPESKFWDRDLGEGNLWGQGGMEDPWYWEWSSGKSKQRTEKSHKHFDQETTKKHRECLPELFIRRMGGRSPIGWGVSVLIPSQWLVPGEPVLRRQKQKLGCLRWAWDWTKLASVAADELRGHSTIYVGYSFPWGSRESTFAKPGRTSARKTSGVSPTQCCFGSFSFTPHFREVQTILLTLSHPCVLSPSPSSHFIYIQIRIHFVWMAIRSKSNQIWEMWSKLRE